MFAQLDVFKTALMMAQHAGQRQAIVAQNIANADTPQYVARDIPSFAEAFRAQNGEVRRRAGHMATGTQWKLDEDQIAQGNPNGNAVSVEQEMLKSVEAKRQHDRAMAIYKSALGMLRSTLRST